MGAAGVEMAEGVISETQGVLQPLIPYLDTLRWLFIGLALIGIGVTIYARLDDGRGGGGDCRLLGTRSKHWDSGLARCTRG